MAVAFALMLRPGATAFKPSTDPPTGTRLKSAATTVGVQTSGVPVTVGVKVGVGGVPVTVGVNVGGVPVTVGVNVAVASVPVGVGVGGVIVPVGVNVEVARVPVDVGVEGVMVPVGVGVAGVIVPVGVLDGVTVCVSDRLRKTTIVCEDAFPCTIFTVAEPSSKFLLIKRFAGMVYTSVTLNPAWAASLIVRVPASTVMSAEQAPTGTDFDLFAKLKLK